MADPRRVAADAARHAEQCTACNDFVARLLESEAALEAALRVPVPQGLAARLLDRRAARRPRWFALAASLLAAVAIAFALGWPRSDALALAGIDFVVFDEAQSIADAEPTDIRMLADTARHMGVSLPDRLGQLHYVCIYPFTGGPAHHLLVKSPLGKVTLLLIPDRTVSARAVGAAYGLEAAVLPAAAGSVVVIGESSRSIGWVETLLKSG